MSNSFRQQFTAWLCLAVAVFMGLSPTVELVVCLDPDGTFGVEAATEAGRCRSCESGETGDSTDQRLPKVESHTECPCVDLPLLAASDAERVAPKSVRLELHAITALPLCVECVPAMADAGDRSGLSAGEPRAPPTLALIRSVVLLV